MAQNRNEGSRSPGEQQKTDKNRNTKSGKDQAADAGQRQNVGDKKGKSGRQEDVDKRRDEHNDRNRVF